MILGLIRKLVLHASFIAIALVSQAALSQPLPAKAFASLPDITNIRLSPDGKKVALLRRYEINDKSGVVLSVFNMDSGTNQTLTTSDNSKFVIAWIRWANNEELFASIHYPGKIYNTPVTSTRLLKFSIAGQEPSSVMPPRVFRKYKYIPVIQDNIVDLVPDNPDEVLLSIRPANAVATNVMRVNHRKNKAALVEKVRPNTINWITDRQNNVRIAYRLRETTLRYDYRDAGSKGKWRELFEFEAFSSDLATPLGFDQDPNILYFSTAVPLTEKETA